MNLPPERQSTERKGLHTELHLKADRLTQGYGLRAKTPHAVLPSVPTLTTILSLRSKIIAKAIKTTDYEKDVAYFLVGLYLFTCLKILS